MSQMVLPQNLSKNSAPEPNSGAAPAAEKSGDSRFDEVSRSEQQRLDAKRADQKRLDEKRADDRKAEENRANDKRSEQAQKTDEAQEPSKAEKTEASAKPSDKTESVEKDTANSATETQKPSGEQADAKPLDDGQAVAAGSAEGKRPSSETADDLLLTLADGETTKKTERSENGNEGGEVAPITFVGLQSLMQPTAAATAGQSAVASGGVVQGTSFQNLLMTGPGMNGNANNGSTAGGQKGVMTGVALAESLLAGAGAEAAKQSADSPLLQNAVRFQGALESLTGSANAVNTPKMAPDAPVLRGYATSIDVPVGHAEWGDKMAGKLTFLTARNMSVAEIHLTPPDMGPMEVKVSVQQDQANITVHSANPAVRDQLELHSHRLRDMLSEQGFSLEKFDVSDQPQQQKGDGEAGQGGDTGQGLMADAESDDAVSEPQSLDLTWKGEVDIFA